MVTGKKFQQKREVKTSQLLEIVEVNNYNIKMYSEKNFKVYDFKKGEKQNSKFNEVYDKNWKVKRRLYYLNLIEGRCSRVT